MGNLKASIVILTTGKAERVLEGISRQTYKNYEVILASEKGIVNAMNKALEKATGDIFIRIDDDVELPERWLEEIMRPFMLYFICGVTGPTYVPQERRKYRDSIRLAESPNWFLMWLYDNKYQPAGIRKCGCVSYDSNYEERIKNYSCTMAICDHLEGTNWAMRTRLIKQVGGFDPKFDGVAEWFDTDVEFKIKKLGYYLFYNKDAYLYHLLEQGENYDERFSGLGRIKNFLRFHWRHGRWRFLTLKFYVYLLIWGGYFVCRRFR